MLGIVKRVLTISQTETLVRVRGFKTGDDNSIARRETIGAAFLEGYHLALNSGSIDTLGCGLARIPPQHSGFAFEGAAMALALLDCLDPSSRRRLDTFLAGDGAAHSYMVHVGAGWIIGRIPWLKVAPHRYAAKFDSTLRWLVVDGFGFHEGYFHWKAVNRSRQGSRLKGYTAHAFDQGLGRSIWFVEACSAPDVATTILSFDSSRRRDLWSGVGLASAYAGGASASAVKYMVDVAGPYSGAYAQGVAFAAKARQCAGNMAVHTEEACRVACQMSAADAAAVTEEARKGLTQREGQPAYELWRTRIQQVFRNSERCHESNR